jgi:tRNA threonylcarbamoyl adenosine modification protein YjeE
MVTKDVVCDTPDDTFRFGEQLGLKLRAGDVILLYGGLGAGKTLLTKGILNALDFDVDEVTSPSFTLVNLYKTPRFDVYHIDLWRLIGGVNAAEAVGLAELLELDNAAVIIEWADRLQNYRFATEPIRLYFKGDGDEPRSITIEYTAEAAAV